MSRQVRHYIFTDGKETYYDLYSAFQLDKQKGDNLPLKNFDLLDTKPEIWDNQWLLTTQLHLLVNH